MKTILICAICAICGQVFGQRNGNRAIVMDTNKFEMVLTTNLVFAHSDFREVNGQLYNIQRSQLWQQLNLQFLNDKDGLVIARKITYQPTYVEIYHPGQSSSGPVSYGNFIGGSSGRPAWTEKRKTGEEKVSGATIALRNCRIKDLTTDSEFGSMAMQVGVYTNGNRKLELWDSGLPHIAPMIITNWVAKKQ